MVVAPLDFLIQLLVALVAGGIIGAEREWKRSSVGLRTFILVSFLGMMSAYLTNITGLQYLIPVALLFVAIAANELYWFRQKSERHAGFTTSTAFVVAFLLGIIVGYGYYLEAVMTSIIVTFLLASKEILHGLIGSATHKEILDALIFAILSFVILPVLPNRTVDPFGLFNPFLVWLMVVLVLGIRFIGYILMKELNVDRAVDFIGLLGGLISSTAVYTAMIQISKKKGMLQAAIAASVLSTAIMLLRIVAVVSVISLNLGMHIFLPFIAAASIGLLLSLVDIRMMRVKLKEKILIDSPLDLVGAFKFGLLFAVVLALSAIAQSSYSNAGVFFIGAVGSLFSIDAALITIATLYIHSTLAADSALIALLLAVGANTVAKVMMASMARTPAFAAATGKQFAAMMVAMLLVSMLQNL